MHAAVLTDSWINERKWSLLTQQLSFVALLTDLYAVHTLFAAQFLDSGTCARTHAHAHRGRHKEAANRKAIILGLKVCDWADRASEEKNSIRLAWLAMDLTFIRTSVCVCVCVCTGRCMSKKEKNRGRVRRKKGAFVVCTFLLFHYSGCFSHQFCVCVCAERESGIHPVCNFTFPLYFFVFPLFWSKANPQRA